VRLSEEHYAGCRARTRTTPAYVDDGDGVGTRPFSTRSYPQADVQSAEVVTARLRRSTGEVPAQAETRRRYCRGEHREAGAQWSAALVRALPRPRRHDVHLTDEDITAVLRATPEHYRPLVITLIGLGLRISEACGLRVEDIDFLRRTVHVHQQRRPRGDMGRLKTGSSARDIPADDTVLKAFAEQIRYWPRRDRLIFSSITSSTTSNAPSGSLSRPTRCAPTSARGS
jgi:integrase